MPSTFAHALFPAACVAMSGKAMPRLTKAQWAKLLFLAAFLGNSPDLDLIPASLMPDQWHFIHRNWGHNIFSVTALAFFGSWLLRRFVSKDISKRQALFLSTSLVLSHLMLDGLGDYAHNGARPSIPFLYPFSDWSFYLPWRLFPCPELHKGVHPFLSHVLSMEFWTKVIFVEVATSVALAAAWAGVLHLGFWLTNKKRQRPTSMALPVSEESPLKSASR